MKNYRTVKNSGEVLLIIEKSKFITYTRPVKTDEEAQAFVKEIKKKHYDANHNAWAYIIDENMGIQKYSDDGEPSGTAGIPILEILRKMKITDACIVVTRYFGGIKLGAGGLVRAYSKSAKAGVVDAGIIEMKIHSLFVLEVDYSLVGKIQQEAKEQNLILKEIEYLEKVKFMFNVIPNKLQETMDNFVNITNGKSQVYYVEDELLITDFEEEDNEY